MKVTSLISASAGRSLEKSGKKKEVASNRLTTGERINTAKDDAAGLAISDKIKSQIRGLNQADRNISDGISLLDTMDGAMDEITDMLNRQRELTIQAMNDSNTTEDMKKIQRELSELVEEIDNTSDYVTFNGVSLLKPDMEKVVIDRNSTIPRLFEIPVYFEEGDDLTIVVNFKDVEFTSEDDPGYPLANANPDNEIYPNFNVGSGVHPDHRFFKGFVYDERVLTGLPNSEYVSHSGDGRNPLIVEAKGIKYYEHEGETFGHSWSLFFKGPSNGVGNMKYTVERVFAEQEEIKIQAGPNSGQLINIERYDCRASALGIVGLQVHPYYEAVKTLDSIDKALETITENRAGVGAMHNRLVHSKEAVQVCSENLSSAKSRLSDADMAKEMMAATKQKFLADASMSIVSQGNQQMVDSISQLLR